MNNIILNGKRFYLKTLDATDISDKYIDWLNDSEVNRYLDVQHIKSTYDTANLYVNDFNNQDKYIFGIYTNNNQHIGNIVLHINAMHNTAYVGYLVGDKSFWGEGASVEAFTILLDYAFCKLGIRKVSGTTAADNIPAIINAKKLGFTQEGKLREECNYDNVLVDVCIFSILKSEWMNTRNRFVNDNACLVDKKNENS